MNIKKLVAELKKDKNVMGIYQFGSSGTVRETPLSDVDICVFTKNNNPKEILKFNSYGDDKIDLSVFDTLPIYVQPEVFKGKSLYSRDKRFLAGKFAVSFRRYQDFKKFEEKYWKTLKKKVSK